MIPDYGSIRRRNTIVQGPGAEERSAARAALPEWIRSLIGLKRSLPHHASNAVMVPGADSRTGRPLAAMGPQVCYYSPQIFVEYELHGGGIDTSGVSFPGASPYPLIGHGKDFAWSGTSANGDNQDTFVERLCNPNGSAPSRRSTHYVYKGRCMPFVTRDQSVRTPFSIADPSAVPQTITYRTIRSVHGPVFAYATVRGAPVALTKAKGVDFHELEAVLPFMRLAENAPTDARSFARHHERLPRVGELVLRRRPRGRLHPVGPLSGATRAAPTSTCRSTATAAATGSASTRTPTPSARSRRSAGRARSRRGAASSSRGTTRRRAAGARARPSGTTAPSTTPSCSSGGCATRSRTAAARPT